MVRLGSFAVGNSFQFGYQMDDVNWYVCIRFKCKDVKIKQKRTWMSIEYICDNGMEPIVHFGAWYCRKENAMFYNGALGRVCCAQGKWQANLVKMILHTVGTTMHTVYSHRYNDEPQ